MTPLPFAQPLWHDAVRTAAEQARAALPETGGRLERAVELVLAGHVELCPDGSARVASQQGGRHYRVLSGSCECPDAAPEGHCKHRLARALARRAMELARQAREPAPPEPFNSAGNGHRSVVAEARAQAERVCQAALAATPPAYRGFLLFLPHHKKVGGTRSNPLYAEVREPYLSVSGRVKMATDEHRDKGATLVIQTAFEVEPHSGQLLCRAQVTSALLGSASAHARVVLGGRGVDAHNPLENAETSAVGRALGLLGYGLLGPGVASADEVLLARALSTPEAAGDTAPPANGPAPAEAPRTTP